jgi:transcriptional regulator with XRE-family HTH domain
MVRFSKLEVIALDALIDFINRRMQEEDIKPADVAQRGKITHAQLSRFLNQEAGFGEAFLFGIARAFNEPREKIFRLVGWLPPTRGDETIIQEIIDILGYLEERHLKELLIQARVRMDLQQKEDEEKERQKKRLKKAIEQASPDERAKLLTHTASKARLLQSKWPDAGHKVQAHPILTDQSDHWDSGGQN